MSLVDFAHADRMGYALAAHTGNAIYGAAGDRTGAARPALVSGHAATFALETRRHAP